MSKLSPEAAAILAAARKDLEASPEVVARVRSAVGARADAEPPPSTVSPRTLWSAAARPGQIAVLALLGSALIVAGYVASSRTVAPNAVATASEPSAESPRPSDPPREDRTPSELADPVPTLPLAALPDRPLPPARPVRTREPHAAPRGASEPGMNTAKAHATTTDDLVEESRLLRSAQVDLQAHRADAAMRSLDEHAARFPAGVLREERLTLRVLVLCETGEIADARRARIDLDRSFPATSHASRLANSCAAATPDGAQ